MVQSFLNFILTCIVLILAGIVMIYAFIMGLIITVIAIFCIVMYRLYIAEELASMELTQKILLCNENQLSLLRSLYAVNIFISKRTKDAMQLKRMGLIQLKKSNDERYFRQYQLIIQPQYQDELAKILKIKERSAKKA